MNITINIDKKTLIGMALIVFMSVFAVGTIALVGHDAAEIFPGAFGNIFTGNWSFMNGSVGIGTLNPTHQLHVIGDLNVSGNIYGNVTDTDNATLGSCAWEYYQTSWQASGDVNTNYTCSAGKVLTGIRIYYQDWTGGGASDGTSINGLYCCDFS